MKALSWLAKVPRFVPILSVAAAEIAAAFVKESLFIDHRVAFVVGSVLSWHYVDLLRSHNMPPSVEMRLWDALVKKWDGKGMSAFGAELRELLDDDLLVPVPPQVESVLIKSLRTEVTRMNDLTQQQPVRDVDLIVQFHYASGIAAHYTRKRENTIYATSLDSPSAFYQGHSDYFDMQVPLKANSKRFERYAKRESKNLESIFKILAGKEVELARHEGGPPNKARIVVIDRHDLAKELTDLVFRKFLTWHVANRVGLKFFLREESPNSEIFEEGLKIWTGLSRQRTIDDFIVYGEDCVFGRVDTKPDKNGRVILGFHYAKQGANADSVMGAYRKYFEDLWNDDPLDDGPLLPKTHTFTELWNEFSGELGGELDLLVELRKAFAPYSRS